MDESKMRIGKLQEKLRQAGIDGFLVTQNVDIYYLAGSMQTGYLYVPQAGEPTFYVRRSVQRAMEEAAVKVAELGSMRTFADRLGEDYGAGLNSGGQALLATEYDVLPVQQFERLKSALPAVRWTDGSLLMRELRMIKSAQEIEKLRLAAAVVDRAFQYGLSRLKPGMSELQVMGEIEHALRNQGHMGMIRMRGYNQELINGIVVSGHAAAVPTYFDGPAGGQGLGAASPQSSGRKGIAENEPILIDIGCMLDGYVTDQTRTVVIGELDADLKEAYIIAEAVLRSTEQLLKPGTRCEDLYAAALEMVEQAGLGAHFMGFGRDQVKFLGHGIGLEIDEFPVLAKGFGYSLEPGMVIAVEPKFTFPGRGVVGIENTYAITPSGFEKLTLTREGIIGLTL